MLLSSTFWTLQAPHDDIVIRIGWAMQNWEEILTSGGSQTGIPFLLIVAAVYAAISEMFVGMAISTKKP